MSDNNRFLEEAKKIKRMIHRDATEPELLHASKITGMTTLLDDALKKIQKGITCWSASIRGSPGSSATGMGI